MLKKTVIKLLNIFNLAIYKKRNADVIYLEDWETLYLNKNKIFQNYQESMESSLHFSFCRRNPKWPP